MFRTVFIALFTAHLIASPTASAANPWEKVRRPSSQESASIGSYSNGCLSGAEQMPLRGEGFQLVRTGRNRHYAHPATVQFLKEFSAQVAEHKLGRLQIGDMSMARGGPFTSGHRSHQMGLDVDIWFSQEKRALERPLTRWERDHISANPLADERAHKLIEKNWNALADKVPHILRLAAEDTRVERIFVHATIKQKLCTITTGEREWLRKLRPWWGHNYHFHVRLNCPEGETYCEPQAPVRGDPCDGLDWWFSDDFYAILRGTAPPKPKPEIPPEPVPMPQQCEQVLTAP